MKIKILLTGIAGIITLIPGLSTLREMQILPTVWEDVTPFMNVTVSLLCAICVMILYGSRARFEQMSGGKAATISVILFGLFLTSMITFIILKGNCVFSDPDNKITEKAFIPISVSEDVSKIIDDPAIGSRIAWVKADGVQNVNSIVQEQEEHTYNIHKSMIIFTLLYLSMFIFLICCILVYGFHLPPGKEMTANAATPAPAQP